MIISETKNIHWPYYLAFEEDLENISRYIEFSEHNYETYSLELARILLSAASEVDVLLKDISKMIDSESPNRNINDCKAVLKKNRAFWETSVVSRRFGLTLTPWVNWGGEENPYWWRSYNNVKHARSTYFKEANLKNTLNAVAGLLILNIEFAFHQKLKVTPDFPIDTATIIRETYPKSHVFRINDLLAYIPE